MKCVIEATAHFLANSVDEGDGVAAMEPIVIVLDTECGVTPGALFLIFSGTGKRLGPPTFLSRRRQGSHKKNQQYPPTLLSCISCIIPPLYNLRTHTNFPYPQLIPRTCRVTIATVRSGFPQCASSELDALTSRCLERVHLLHPADNLSLVASLESIRHSLTSRMPRPHQLDGDSSAPAVPPTLLIVDSTSSWERTEALAESAGRGLGGAADVSRQVGWKSAELSVVTVLVQGTAGWKKDQTVPAEEAGERL